MDTEDDIADTCSRCDAPIEYGNPRVSINRNIEQVERGVIEVIDSQQLLTLCGRCGNRLDSATIAEALHLLIAR